MPVNPSTTHEVERSVRYSLAAKMKTMSDRRARRSWWWSAERESGVVAPT